MKKIGFIDFFLDEWHANNYPSWIRERANLLNLHWDVAFAWAKLDKENGLTTEQWCDKQKVKPIQTIEELVELSDALIVLSPDHPEQHEILSELALKSGKPVYIDKTFAPSVVAAQAMFTLAAQNHTPLFSSSALRYAVEIQNYKATHAHMIDSVSITGPGSYSNYAVHQFEIIVALLGTDIKRVKSLSTAHTTYLVVEYNQGQIATFQQTASAPFQAFITNNNGETEHVQQFSDMFLQLIDHILLFFNTGDIPVKESETIAVMKLIEAGKAALKQYDTWVNVSHE